MHTANCILTTAYCTLHTALYTLNVEQWKLHNKVCTLHTANCTFHTAHCTLHTEHYTLHTVHYIMSTAHCRLYSGLLAEGHREYIRPTRHTSLSCKQCTLYWHSILDYNKIYTLLLIWLHNNSVLNTCLNFTLYTETFIYYST